MKLTIIRLLLIIGLIATWTLGVAQNTVTLNLSLRSPADAAANKGTLDGMVFYSGSDFGDQIVYPLFGGTGTKSFQISSPGENLSKTITTSDYFNIRPTTNGYVIDKTKIMNFSGPVSNITGSITVTLKQLVINTYSVQETSPAPGDQITIVYQTGKGSYPNPTSFGVQLLDNSGNKVADLQNLIDTKIPDQEDFGFSVGGNRSIKATLPSTIAAGTYKVRVIATTKSTTVIGGASAPFTIKAASPPTTTPTSINPTTVCPGGQLTLSADVIDDGLLAVRETPDNGGGGRYYVNYYNAATGQQVLAIQNYTEAYVGTPTVRAAGQYTANNKISGPMTIPPADKLPPGRYYCRIFVNSRDEVVLNPSTAGVTPTFTVSAPPTAVISDSKPSINAGEVAVVKIKFGGDGPWSFGYDMLNGSNYTKVDETLTEISAYINPTSDYLFDASKLLNFRNRVCSGTVSGSSQIRVSKLTVTTGAVTPSPACPNVDALKVTYSVNGVAPAGTKFYAQIKDKDGNYQTIGEGTSTPITCGIGRPISAFPVAVGGTDYAVRVISADGSIQTSSVTTTVKLTRPNAPVVPSPEYCQNNPVASIKVDGDIMYYGIYKDVRDDAHRTAYNSKTPPPPPTTVGTYYYELVQFDSRGCESIGIDMIVKVKDSASPPGDATVEYCKGASASPLTTGASSPVWYNNNSTAPLGGAPTPPTDNVTTLVYKVAQGGNCPSGQSTITVKIKPVPDPPKVTNPQAICQFGPAPVLVATPLSSGSLRWYDASNTPLPSAPTPSWGSATQTYYVSEVAGGCEGAKAKIDQTFAPATPAPTAPTVAPYCQGQEIPALSATPSAGGTLNWYGTSATAGTASATPTVPNNQNSSSYYVSQTVSGCEGSRTSIAVTVRPTPGAPKTTSVQACLNLALPALAPNVGIDAGNTLAWYSAATGGTGSAAAPAVPTSATGAQSVYVAQSVGTCEGPRAELKITVNPIPAAPAATDPGPLCQYQLVSSSSFTAQGDNLQWYANGQTTGTAQPAITDSSLPATFTVAVTQTVNSCVSPAKVISQKVNPAPPLPTGTPLQLCLNDAAKPLSASASPGNSLTWYGMNATGGTPSATAPSITAGSVRTEMYYFTQTDGTTKCESKRQSVVAKIDTKPGPPTVTASQFACLNTTQIALSATASNPLVWSSPLVSTTSTAAPSPPTNTVTTAPYRYTVVQVLGSCVSDASLIDYSIKPLPTAPTLQSPQVACVGQPALNLVAVGQNLKWYKDAALTTALTPSVPTTQSLSEIWYVTQTDGNGCRSATATPLDVRIRAQATATISGDDRITAYDSTAIRIKLGGDGPWTMTLWDGTTVSKTLKNPYVKWERPLATRTYSITTLSNDCGVGVASNTYTLIVDKPLGVDPLSPATLSMTISPNPTTGLLNVEWSALKRQAVRLRFLSAGGAVVWQAERVGTGTTQTETIQVGDRPAGIYFLQLQSDSAGLLVRKLVKQ